MDKVQRELNDLMRRFDEYRVDLYCSDNNISKILLTEDEKNEIRNLPYGPADLGAVYRWPRNSGGYLDVYGFGIIESKKSGIHFVAAHNSKKKGGMKFTYLDPVLILKMIEQGEVQYMGNILDANGKYRKTVDWERVSLSVCGFLSAYQTSRKQQACDVQGILDKLEKGEMNLSELLDKAKMHKDLFEE